MDYLQYRKPIFNVISDRVLNNPDKIAVELNGQTLTYRKLEELSDRLASYIIAHYPQSQGGRVAVYLQADVMLPVVLLGIMKSGCAYVPLSYFHPPERIKSIINDSAAFLMISTQELIKEKHLGKYNIQHLDITNRQIFNSDYSVKFPELNGNELAYILYTSGSTGIPKGVAIEHACLNYYVHWFNQELWEKTRPVLPLTSSLSFAAAVAQLYAPLLRGDTLHMLPDQILHQPDMLCRWFAQVPGAALYCVPTVWDEILRYYQSAGDQGSLALPKTLYLSGEPVPAELKARTFAQSPGMRVFNLYGPTETTANGSYAELKALAPVTIGQAIAGSEIMILDEDGQPVADGETGEICIIGPGVARGYWHRKDLTRQRFFEAGHFRGHRTGDLGQIVDGQLICLGRKDHQIKIGGVRIEPGETEAVLLNYPGVTQAVVKTTGGPGGQTQLVAYLVQPETQATVRELRNFLRAYLPDVMIPAHFIYISQLPKLPNGKLDSKRLPAPCPLRPQLGYDCEVAQNDLERELIDIWEEVLQFSGLGSKDNFFDLGGSSLQAMKIRQLIRLRLYCNIDYGLFAEHPTPRELATIVPYYSCDDEDEPAEDGQGESRDHPALSAGAGSSERGALLSSQQRYFITLDQISAEPATYQIPFKMSVKGEADIDGLIDSLQQVLRANPVLRSRFDLDEELCFEGAYRVEEIAVRRHSASMVPGPLSGLSDHDLLALLPPCQMDLEETPLIQIDLISDECSDHVFVIRVHHAVFDHDSIALFYQQFIRQYRRILAGDASTLPAESVTYADYSHWQQMHQPGDEAQEKAFWRHTLQDYVRHGADASGFQVYGDQEGPYTEQVLTSAVTAHIHQAARAQQTSPFVLMLTAFNRLLEQETPYRQVPVGIPVSTRMQYEPSSLTGCFVNLITYFDPADATEPLMTRLTKNKRRIYALMDHLSLPYDAVIQESRQAEIESQVRVPVGFNFLSAMPAAENVGECQFTVKAMNADYVRFDLALTVNDGKEMSLTLHYRPGLFSRQQIDVLLDKYQMMLVRL
ncbi:Tyrocidine synthase 3 [Vibrio aerogenes CECT 7868]|uniref:Tyrocidine synthase 3 n=1 Tax=Vibrio aerogenes CECT 7868 TaxID=1216006 RepID=A0A1M5ZSS2_9VIBR|nr:amino acid adenylation domain-containing protein [Vibrio aerogenes]SHI27355.1 Tyrocidine synthase 3 [Vibrio aerogenes CECT 7868]